MLDDLEGSFDKEIYPEQKKEDFDALDDREYTVTITAKQWRALGRALDAFTPTECANYLAHAGYVPSARKTL